MLAQSGPGSSSTRSSTTRGGEGKDAGDEVAGGSACGGRVRVCGLRRRRGRARPAAARRRPRPRPKRRQKFPADSTLGKIQEKGEITIGVKFDVPPFGFQNPQTNEVEGFDVEMGKAVAAKLGVEPKFIEAISDNRIPFLEDGTADLILSTMTINEERVGEIDFSDPYFIARGRVLVPGDSDITGVERSRRQEGLHGARLDLRGEPQGAGAGGRPQARRLLLGVPGADPERRGRRGLHGRRDPHRHDHPGRHAEARRRGAHAGALRRRHQEGRDRDDRFVNGVFKEVKDSGKWAELLRHWIGKYTGQQASPRRSRSMRPSSL